MGYWMRTEDAGKGFMTEAGVALLDFGFGELRLHRVELEAGVDNIGSQRVAEKLGFRREGRAREAGWAGVGYYDTIRYGLLRTDSRP
jgi:RimJ/RimL family protein N-acetyltransferase